MARCFSCIPLLLATLMNSVMADTGINQQIHQLDQQFQQLSADVYSAYGRILHDQPAPQDLQQLQQQVDDLLQGNDLVGAVSLVNIHKQLIIDQFDDRRMFKLVALLLEYNAWETASDIYSFVKADSEKSIISNLSFIFARHHLRRNEWQKTVDTLEGSYEDLAEEDASYARLITGIALQKLKRHRQALEYYAKIPASSRYYIHARLNTATAYIRQGWWTDAQTTIKTTLAGEHISKPDEMVNRLYLVLGYSMLQKEYYRNSRDAFRHIGLDSQYTNRALLGIALSAASQEDYIGALNALSILKNTTTRDISVDECYLLFPFTYQKLNQQMTASATYSEAINYYQARILEIDNLKLLTERAAMNVANIGHDNRTITINDNALNYAARYPVAFLSNLKRLEHINNTLQQRADRLPRHLLDRVQVLLKQQEILYRKIIIELLDERREFLASYLNQSRYGLANLYDSSILNEQ